MHLTWSEISLDQHFNSFYSTKDSGIEEQNEKLFSSVCGPSHLNDLFQLTENCGIELAQKLLDLGAEDILQEAKRTK